MIREPQTRKKLVTGKIVLQNKVPRGSTHDRARAAAQATWKCSIITCRTLCEGEAYDRYSRAKTVSIGRSKLDLPLLHANIEYPVTPQMTKG